MKRQQQIFRIACLFVMLFLLSATSIFAIPKHDWGPWIVDKEPTCVSDGHKHRICTQYPDNPHREDVDIPATGKHVYEEKVKEPTCTAAGEKSMVCKVCGHIKSSQTLPALGHDYGPWKTVRKATETKEGLMQRVCSRNAAHIETKAIPMLKAETEPATAAPSVVPEAPAPSDTAPSDGPNALDAAIPAVGAASCGTFGVFIYRDFLVMGWYKRKKSVLLMQRRGGGR